MAAGVNAHVHLPQPLSARFFISEADHCFAQLSLRLQPATLQDVPTLEQFIALQQQNSRQCSAYWFGRLPTVPSLGKHNGCTPFCTHPPCAFCAHISYLLVDQIEATWSLPQPHPRTCSPPLDANHTAPEVEFAAEGRRLMAGKACKENPSALTTSVVVVDLDVHEPKASTAPSLDPSLPPSRILEDFQLLQPETRPISGFAAPDESLLSILPTGPTAGSDAPAVTLITASPRSAFSQLRVKLSMLPLDASKLSNWQEADATRADRFQLKFVR